MSPHDSFINVALDEAYNRYKTSWSKVKKRIFENFEKAKATGVKFPSKGIPVCPIYLGRDWQGKLKKCVEKIGDVYNPNKITRRFGWEPQIVHDDEIAEAIYFGAKDFIAVISRDYGLRYDGF